MIEFTTGEALLLAAGALGIGIIMLIRGGNWTIDAAVFVAKKYGISPMIIGFTIVAFGTSLPELLVSINANIKGSPSISLGNVIGSNIANILLVIGVTSIIATLHTIPRDVIKDMIVMLISTIVLTFLMLYGYIDRIVGGIMILSLIGYVFWQYKMALSGKIEIEEIEDDLGFNNLKSALFFLFCGMGFIAFGSEFLVRGAQISATIIGVPEAVIALSIIAIGTSLPELSTCIIAALKRQSSIIIGNIIGSNVFNILMIVGATALTKSIPFDKIDAQLINLDIWVMSAISFLFAAIILIYKKITPTIGIIFCTIYLAYMILIFFLYMNPTEVIK